MANMRKSKKKCHWISLTQTNKAVRIVATYFHEKYKMGKTRNKFPPYGYFQKIREYLFS